VLVTADRAVPGAAALGDVLAGGRPATYAEVLRAREVLVPNGETVAMAVPPQSAQLVRGADEILGLLGARCVDCGTINTPPTIHPHCISCGSSKFVLEPVARHGVVHTYVINHTMPAPFQAPLPLAVVDLDDGARVMLQVAGDGSTLTIGSEVDLVLRRYARERGVPVYGYKAAVRPAATADDGAAAATEVQ
jgi:hydroxymethylglutaryl-CoA synthase